MNVSMTVTRQNISAAHRTSPELHLVFDLDMTSDDLLCPSAFDADIGTINLLLEDCEGFIIINILLALYGST